MNSKRKGLILLFEDVTRLNFLKVFNMDLHELRPAHVVRLHVETGHKQSNVKEQMFRN